MEPASSGETPPFYFETFAFEQAGGAAAPLGAAFCLHGDTPSVMKTSPVLLSRAESGPLLGFLPVERHRGEAPVPAKGRQILDLGGDGATRGQEDESGITCRIGARWWWSPKWLHFALLWSKL